MKGVSLFDFSLARRPSVTHEIVSISRSEMLSKGVAVHLCRLGKFSSNSLGLRPVLEFVGFVLSLRGCHRLELEWSDLVGPKSDGRFTLSHSLDVVFTVCRPSPRGLLGRVVSSLFVKSSSVTTGILER